jgi:hypothetical protein
VHGSLRRRTHPTQPALPVPALPVLGPPRPAPAVPHLALATPHPTPFTCCSGVLLSGPLPPTAVPVRAGQQRRQRRAMRAAAMTRCPWTHPARTGWWTVPPDVASWCGEEQTCPLRRCSPGPPTVQKKGLRALVHISYLQPIQ